MNYEEIVSIPCSKLKLLPSCEIDAVVDTVIDHYYTEGFPYYPVDKEKIQKEKLQLKALDTKRLTLPENRIQQSMVGLNTVNSFHPEMWSVKCRRAKTPMELFCDRAEFHKALVKRVRYSDTKLAVFNIRKTLKIFGGVQAVSNFRPSVAKWVYDNFSSLGAYVLDPCAGYGGRLFGALCSGVGLYVGVDPNAMSVSGNKRLTEYVNENKKVVLVQKPFEEFEVDTKFDLVFTSPPYFDIEKYSNDDTQSFVRYPTLDSWVNGFLRPLIHKSHFALKDGGYLVLNVGGQIVEKTAEIGDALFGKHETYWMRLSKALGNGKKAEVSHKEEPVFVWRKPLA